MGSRHPEPEFPACHNPETRTPKTETENPKRSPKRRSRKAVPGTHFSERKARRPEEWMGSRHGASPSVSHTCRNPSGSCCGFPVSGLWIVLCVSDFGFVDPVMGFGFRVLFWVSGLILLWIAGYVSSDPAVGLLMRFTVNDFRWVSRLGVRVEWMGSRHGASPSVSHTCRNPSGSCRAFRVYVYGLLSTVLGALRGPDLRTPLDISNPLRRTASADPNTETRPPQTLAHLWHIKALEEDASLHFKP